VCHKAAYVGRHNHAAVVDGAVRPAHLVDVLEALAQLQQHLDDGAAEHEGVAGRGPHVQQLERRPAVGRRRRVGQQHGAQRLVAHRRVLGHADHLHHVLVPQHDQPAAVALQALAAPRVQQRRLGQQLAVVQVGRQLGARHLDVQPAQEARRSRRVERRPLARAAALDVGVSRRGDLQVDVAHCKVELPADAVALVLVQADRRRREGDLHPVGLGLPVLRPLQDPQRIGRSGPVAPRDDTDEEALLLHPWVGGLDVLKDAVRLAGGKQRLLLRAARAVEPRVWVRRQNQLANLLAADVQRPVRKDFELVAGRLARLDVKPHVGHAAAAPRAGERAGVRRTRVLPRLRRPVAQAADTGAGTRACNVGCGHDKEQAGRGREWGVGF